MKGTYPAYSTRKTALAVAVVVVLLASTLGIALLGGPSSSASGAEKQKITYYANNGTDDYYEVEYSGVASTEYNPEYWEGSVDGVDVENWQGATVSGDSSLGTVTLNVYNLRTSSGSTAKIHIDSEIVYKLADTSTTVSGGGWSASVTEGTDSDGYYIQFTVTKSGGNSNSANTSVNLEIVDTVKKVFAGWAKSPTAGSADYLPGDVVTSDVNALYAVWITPDRFIPSSMDESVTLGNNQDVTYVPTQSTLFPVLNTSNGTLVPFSNQNSYSGTWYFGDGRSDRSMFGTVYCLKSSTTYKVNGVTLPTGTYRSVDLGNMATVSVGGICKVGAGGVVIDNVYMVASSSTGANHGDGSNASIQANGNSLVLGTGITLPSGNSSSVSNNNPVGPQIIGGSSTATLYATQTKKMPFCSYDLSGGRKGSVSVGIATHVLIHSGIYYNVVAGSVSRDIGSSSSPASTYLVMKGGTVLDTVIGGCGGTGWVYGVTSSGSEADCEFQGGTFVYMLGADMPGDDYEDAQSGFYSYLEERDMYTLPESTILEGGCSDGTVWGSTHVFLSGDTTVFDVQAGGRRGNSVTTFTYLEITGDATVRHIACGTITDGNSYSKNCVHGTRVVVDGNANVATLLGGGYDTWSAPNSPSMTEGTVNVEVYGGTVGYVYGGGFRGSLGTTSTSVTVNVSIVGGVILNDVYGGGRGGIEKVLHNSDGTYNAAGDGFKDSTGKSYVYGNVNVTVGHKDGIFKGVTAEIRGNVYGGGESVPLIKSYSASNANYTSFSTINSNVAAVFGDISVRVLGSVTVGGDVYGSGRGLSYDSDGKLSSEDITEYSTMYVIGYGDSGFEPVNVALFADGVATYYTSTEKDMGTFAQVCGTSAVTVSGGTVDGSVYGGGAYGVTTQSGNSDKVICSVSVESGTVNGSVYGGGIGRAGEVSVNGSTSVSVSGGRINGNVYGGACYGIVAYNVETVVSGGVVGGSVYGGGYGVNGYKAVGGTRKMGLKNTYVVGNVYGGSALGDDGSSTSQSNVYVVISSGVTVGGSVYGGGFQGSTYGNAIVYIGYEYDGSLDVPSVPMADYADSRITIGGSVYAGGDVGDLSDDMQTYTTVLVHGDGRIVLDGQNVPISIAGSLMGSGNSCLTEGYTSIAAYSFNNLSAMGGIHRADNVILCASTLILNGRGTVNSDGDTELYSLYGIGDLVLQNATHITLYSAVDNIGAYRSLNKDGSATTPTSPLNAFVFGAGDVIKFRTTDGDIAYSPVIGNTILSTLTSESAYGGYVLGALSSTGGFVTLHSGSYLAADRTDYDLCRCWFISGTMSVSTTMMMLYSGTDDYCDASAEAEIGMIMLQGTTRMVYTGGSYIESNPNRFSFSGDYVSEVGKFNLLVGSDNTSASGNLLLDGGAGVYFTPSDDGRYAATGESGGSLPRTSNLYLKFSGTVQDETIYLGYVTLYFQEVSDIQYETANGTETSQIIVNYTEIRVDLYVRGASGLDDVDISIGTTRGTGSTDMQIPPVNKYSGADLYVVGMSSSTGGTDSITISAENNLNNTSGWTYLQPGTTLSPGYSGSTHLGTLQGGYIADLKFAVSGFDSSDAQKYEVEFSLHLLDGTVLGLTVTVTVEALADVGVTFVDGQQDYSIKYYFGYGYTLQSSDCPPNLNNFIGWYTDPSFNNIYNFKAPLTADLVLYARYALTVTFDNGDGTSSMLNVQEVVGGIRISPPTEPVRNGYQFSGWYKDSDYAVAWDFDTDVVKESMTLYAKWSGVTVDVKFQYLDGNAERQYVTVDGSVYTLRVSYGGIFGLLDEVYSAQQKKDVTYLDRAEEIVRGIIPEEFIRWSAAVNGQQVAIYDDTYVTFYDTVDGSYCVVLTAITSSVALRIDTDANSSDLTGEVEPPSTFLVYPTGNGTDDGGSYYTFEFDLNGASRTGWSLLGWALSPDAEEFLGSGTTVKLKVYYHNDGDRNVVDRFVDGDGNTVSELTAGGVINDASDPYVITYYAIWSQITYTVTVIPSSHGVIDAYFGGVVGTTFSAHYGDVITLRYTPEEGYNFYSWFANGEGSFGDRYSPSSTFVVTGNSSIYCVATGPQVVRLHAYFDGGVGLATVPGAMFSGTDGNYDMTFEGWYSDGEQLYAQYYVMVAPGTYGVCLVGESGTPYRFQDLTVSESVHSTTIRVITVDNGVTVGETGQTAGGTTGLESFPEFIIPGTSIDIGISAGYVFDITVSYGSTQEKNSGTASADKTLSFNVPADATGPISIIGKLTVADKTVIIHIRTMDIGGESWSDYGSEAMAMSEAGETYSGKYFIKSLPGFTVNTQLSEEQSDITSFTVSGGYIYFTLDAGDPIIVCYDRMSATAQISVDMLATVNTDMSSWTRGVSGTTVTYTKTVWYDETIVLPDVSRDGYTMNGWNMSGCSGEDEKNTYTVTAADVSADNVLEFTADLSDAIHVLTLITQYGTFSNGTSRYSVGVKTGENLQDYLEMPVLSASDKGRYEFAGWADIVEKMPGHDVTYTAVWNLVTQTLRFTGDDHVQISATDNSTGVSSGSNVPHGDYVTVTIVFDDGYSILNYSPSGTAIGAPVQGVDRQHYSWSFYMSDDVEIEISSALSMYRVFFVVNGVLDQTLTQSYSKYADCYFGPFSKPGYKESLWYTDAQCTTEAAKGSDSRYYVQIVSDVTFYTTAQANTYSVTFDANGGAGTMVSQQFSYGKSASLNAHRFTYDNHVFLGWSDSATGALLYAPGATVSNLTSVDNGSVTLYAVWAVLGNVSVKYDGADHGGVLSASPCPTAITVYYAEVNLTHSNYLTSGTVDKLTYRNAGSHTVYFYLVADAERSGTSVVIGSFTVSIEKRDVTITSGSSTRAYNGAALVNNTVTYSGDGFIKGEGVKITFTGSQTVVDHSDNTFQYTFTEFTDAVNYNISVVYGVLTVTAKSDNIEVDTELKATYGDTGVSVGAKSPAGTTLTYVSSDQNVVTVGSDGTITIVSAGTATITVTMDAYEGYEKSTVDVSVTVEKKALTVNGFVLNTEKVYDGTNDAVIKTQGTLVGIIGSDDVILSSTARYKSVNAGTVDIVVNHTLSGSKAGNYSVADPEPVSGNISKRSVTITSASASKVYDKTALTAESYTLAGDFVSGERFTITYSGSQTVVGTGKNIFQFTLTGSAVSDNYNISQVYGDLEVTVRYIDVPKASQSYMYTGKEVSAATVIPTSDYYTISGSGLDVGDYNATVKLKDTVNTAWNTVPSTTDDQTVVWHIVQNEIDKEKFTVNTDSETYTSQAIVKVVESSYEIGKDYTVTYSDNTDVGTATITITGTGGYGGTLKYTFKITAKPVTVSIGGHSIYDGTVHSATFEIDGLCETDVGKVSVAFSENGTAIIVGEYVAKVDKLTGDRAANYKINSDVTVSGTWSITARPVYMIAGSASGTYGSVVTCPGYSVIGIVQSDADKFSFAVAGSQSEVGSSANTITYKVTDGKVLANYDITVINGTLTVYPVFSSVVSVTSAAETVVEYHANGGEGTMEATHSSVAEFELAENSFTMEGCTFDGWSLTPGGQKAYGDGATVSDVRLGANLALYAVWKHS